jgi:hypothetical protein
MQLAQWSPRLLVSSPQRGQNGRAAGEMPVVVVEIIEINCNLGRRVIYFRV